jgi:hypothetical protein
LNETNQMNQINQINKTNQINQIDQMNQQGYLRASAPPTISMSSLVMTPCLVLL